MRRRKITTKLFVIAFYFIAQQSFAQKMYVNVHAGYNFNSAPLTSINSTSNGSSSTTYDRVDISLGKGVNLDAAFGYMFNKHFEPFIELFAGLAPSLLSPALTEFCHR